MLWLILTALPAAAQVPPGSYLQSCRNVRFDGYMLSAFCEGINGQGVPTRIAAGNCRGDIANINGQLVCAGGGRERRGPPPQFGGYRPPPPPPRYGGGEYGGGFGLPGGSWRGSCGNPEMRGPILFADCQRVDGRVQRARGDTRACRRFANVNGQLTCE